MTRLAKTGPAVVFSLLQQLEALGLNLPGVLQQLGIQSNGGTPPGPSGAPPAEPESPLKGKKA
ncbi:MAG: hypothetical protein HY234_07235 [Acidobacteria bacterium]|nr:hypothetical protein [Acidobacteriota bacterium]